MKIIDYALCTVKNKMPKEDRTSDYFAATGVVG